MESGLTADNLFLVLYEDLRVYTIWRAEVSHFQMQHMSYRKTGTEVSGDSERRELEQATV